MRSFAVLAAAVGLVSANAHGGSWGTGAPVYVTDVVTAYTTYCPSATKISHNGVTYTVTEATTLTISNCPCTVTRPVSSFVSTSTSCASATPVVTKPASTGAVTKASSYFPSVAAASSTTASSAAATYTGAASKAQVAGAGLLAVLGAAAVAL